MAPNTTKTSERDRDTLRDLVRRYAETAQSEANRQRIALWKAHNDLEPGRPLVLLFPEGSWGEIGECCGFPLFDDPALGRFAWSFWSELWLFEHCTTDMVLRPWYEVPKAIVEGSWGLEAEWTHAPAQGGARTFKPVLTSERDLEKLKVPRIHHDEAKSGRDLAFAQELIGDLIEVRLVGRKHVSFHLMAQLTAWHGLEETMESMMEQPELVHAVMRFLCDAHLSVLHQLEAQGLLEHNADNTYHNSGGNSWTDALPSTPGVAAKPEAMWGSAESQELAAVGPRQHREFALEYEKPLLARFARNGYGCCEDLTNKLDDVLTIPNIRRISMSPWANVPKAAERLGRRAIFSWKPHPGHLVGTFDEDRVRAYVRAAVEACARHDCVLEIILKDTHTCERKPERFVRFSEIASEEAGAQVVPVSAAG
jgi:hypothetical protein